MRAQTLKLWILLAVVGAHSAVVFGGVINTESTCVKKGLVLECPDNEIIRIISVTYGYSTNQTEANLKQCKKQPEDTCTKEIPDSLIPDCAGAQVCETFIEDEVLFSCNKKANYVEVQYMCDPKTHLIGLCTQMDGNIEGEGIIESPNYPYGIPSSSEQCYCVINWQEKPENASLLFSLVGRHLMGDSKDCLQYFKVGDMKDHNELCGSMDRDIPFQRFFSSSEKTVQVSFRNKYHDAHGSFKLIFQAKSADGEALSESSLHVSCQGTTDTTILPIDYVTVPSTTAQRHEVVATTTTVASITVASTTVASTTAGKPAKATTTRPIVQHIPSGWYNPGQVAGIVIGVLLVILVIVGGVYFFKRRASRNVYIHKFP